MTDAQKKDINETIETLKKLSVSNLEYIDFGAKLLYASQSAGIQISDRIQEQIEAKAKEKGLERNDLVMLILQKWLDDQSKIA